MDQGLEESKIYPYRYLIAFISIGLIYFLNMFIDVMDIDAAQYASISREMWQTKSFLEVYHHGLDYLDKPPLLFWLSSFSLGMLGTSSFAYKLPAVLIIILGIYSTFRFTLMWYDRKKAIYAALILATTQAMFLVTNDIRTDGILTGFIIFSVWQMSRFLNELKFKYLIYAAIGVAAAMMTKGPIGVVLVAFAIGGDLLIKGQWKSIFKWEWIVFLFIVAILLIPMSYGLYTQFDLHPEKEVYGLTGPSGLRFFYWTQSFGRITGENYWNNDAGFFFFFHTILWDFQPWIFILIPALFLRFKTLILSKLRIKKDQEYISFFGFVLGFLALSTSGFKLPHYIFPLFPFAAIFTADFIASFSDKKVSRRFARFQFGFMHLFFVVMILSLIWIFEAETILLPLFLLFLFVLFWYSFLRVKDIGDKIMLPTLVAIIAFGLFMSISFYPNLLNYQSDSLVGKEVSRRNTPEDMFYIHRIHENSLDFYADRRCEPIEMGKLATYKEGTLIYTNQEGMEEIIAKHGQEYSILYSYEDFHVTGITFDFLIKSKRENVVEKKYLLEKN